MLGSVFRSLSIITLVLKDAIPMNRILPLGTSIFSRANSASSHDSSAFFIESPFGTFCCVFMSTSAAISRMKRMPALRYFILSIRFVRSDKQMRRVDAGRIIASVTNQHVIRDRSNESDIAKPVGLDINPAKSQPSISEVAPTALPFPASSFSILSNSLKKSAFRIRTVIFVVERSQRFFFTPLLVMRLAQRAARNRSATVWKCAFHRL
jgi:hypothetical protein